MVEDLHRRIVVPVVDDHRHDVGVPAVGYTVEEAAGNDAAAIRDTRGGEDRRCARDDVCLVEEHAAHARARGEDAGQQAAAAAAYVHDGAERREVIGGDHGAGTLRRSLLHGIVEGGPIVPASGPKRPRIRPVSALKEILTRADRSEQVRPPIVEQVSVEKHTRPRRSLMAYRETCSERRESEAAIVNARDETKARQRAEQTEERWLVDAGGRGQLRAVARAIGEPLRDLEPRGDGEEL